MKTPWPWGRGGWGAALEKEGEREAGWALLGRDEVAVVVVVVGGVGSSEVGDMADESVWRPCRAASWSC